MGKQSNTGVFVDKHEVVGMVTEVAEHHYRSNSLHIKIIDSKPIASRSQNLSAHIDKDGNLIWFDGSVVDLKSENCFIRYLNNGGYRYDAEEILAYVLTYPEYNAMVVVSFVSFAEEIYLSWILLKDKKTVSAHANEVLNCAGVYDDMQDKWHHYGYFDVSKFYQSDDKLGGFEDFDLIINNTFGRFVSIKPSVVTLDPSEQYEYDGTFKMDERAIAIDLQAGTIIGTDCNWFLTAISWDQSTQLLSLVNPTGTFDEVHSGGEFILQAATPEELYRPNNEEYMSSGAYYKNCYLTDRNEDILASIRDIMDIFYERSETEDIAVYDSCTTILLSVNGVIYAMNGGASGTWRSGSAVYKYPEVTLPGTSKAISLVHLVPTEEIWQNRSLCKNIYVIDETDYIVELYNNKYIRFKDSLNRGYGSSSKVIDGPVPEEYIQKSKQSGFPIINYSGNSGVSVSSDDKFDDNVGNSIGEDGFDMSVRQITTLNAVLKNLRSFCIKRGCDTDACLYESNGVIALTWGNTSYLMQGDRVSIHGADDSEKEKAAAKLFLTKTIELLVKKVPLPVKRITFSMSPQTKGKFVNSAVEAGSVEFLLTNKY